MAVKLGNGNWAVKEDKLLAYNDNSGRFFNKEFDFDRGSSATYVAKEGLIKSAASDVPRIDFSDSTSGALLLEPQRSNLITYSEAFDNGYWIKNGLLTPTSGFLSPNGDLSAFKIVEDTSNAVHRIRISSLASGAAASKEFTYSFFVKKSEVKWFLLKGVVNTQSLTVNVWFDLENGVIGTESNGSGKIENYGNDWYRCSINIATNSSATSINVYGYLADDDNSESYQGDGTSGLYIYGAQLEQSFATSYIPSLSGSTTTRLADVCNNSGSAQDFNSEEGVLYAEISASESATNKYINIYKDANNRILLWITSSGTIRGYAIVNSSGSNVFIDTVGVDVTNNNKIALRWQGFTLSLFVNGTKIGDSTVTNNFSMMGLTTLDLKDVTNVNHFYGKTKDLQVFTEAKSDEQLAALTTI